MKLLPLASTLALFLYGCAAGPAVPQKVPATTINTIPQGADISVNGNYIGKSPVEFPMPVQVVDYGAYNRRETRADQPMVIEAQMAGYETKTINFGEFHNPEQKVIQPVFSSSAVVKTAGGYYTFGWQVTMKLAPVAAK
ncbi:MAG: PEGA domain-containing protein [bacterium]|nr:PEGA domain-containing protein [bacterium]MDI1335634.1 PEGA domain-containing protein [Lacunisphaera sp.]